MSTKHDNIFDALFDDLDAQAATQTPTAEHVIETESEHPVANPLTFMLAGKAIFTLRSRRTGNRFTFKVERKKDEDGRRTENFWFVSLLTGPANTQDYTYLGCIRPNTDKYLSYGSHSYYHDKKQRISPEAPSAVAFAWTFKKLANNVPTPDLQVFHMKACGRCGLPLTVPESIASGFGPECAGKVGL